MTFRVGGTLLLLLALPVQGSGDDPKKKPATPAEQYQALVKGAEKAQADFYKALGDATFEDQRKLLKNAPDFGPRFLALAERYPKDPVALEALVRVVTGSLTQGPAPNVTEALKLLLRDHMGSEKLAGVCEALGSRIFQGDAEAFLLAVLEKSPRKDVQAEACLALAQLPNWRALSMAALKTPADAKELVEDYGEAAVAFLKKLDVNQQKAASAKYYRRFIDQYTGQLSSRRVVRLSWILGYATEALGEETLRSLLAKDLRNEVQGPVLLSLARFLRNRASTLPEPDSKEAAMLLAESERLLEQAARKYPNVRLEFAQNQTVGKQAEKDLLALRQLSVGKIAPDIEGQDQDGKRFKLSDYRGKVVLLDFWNQF